MARIFNIHPNGVPDSGIWLLHGWRHVKLPPSRRKLCVHHSTMHQFTVSLHSKQTITTDISIILMTNYYDTESQLMLFLSMGTKHTDTLSEQV